MTALLLGCHTTKLINLFTIIIINTSIKTTVFYETCCQSRLHQSLKMILKSPIKIINFGLECLLILLCDVNNFKPTLIWIGIQGYNFLILDIARDIALLLNCSVYQTNINISRYLGLRFFDTGYWILLAILPNFQIAQYSLIKLYLMATGKLEQHFTYLFIYLNLHAGCSYQQTENIECRCRFLEFHFSFHTRTPISEIFFLQGMVDLDGARKDIFAVYISKRLLDVSLKYLQQIRH